MSSLLLFPGVMACFEPVKKNTNNDSFMFMFMFMFHVHVHVHVLGPILNACKRMKLFLHISENCLLLCDLFRFQLNNDLSS